MMISAQSDMEVVGEVANAKAAVRQVEEIQPDVLVLDLAMPGGGSIEAIEKISKQCEGTRVLVLSMYDDAAYLQAVLASGGAGYLAKSVADGELLEAIRMVHAGRSYVNVALDDETPHPPGNLEPGLPPIQPVTLSPREIEVLRLLAFGHTNREIGEQLHLSVKTVESYRARISDKLSLKTRAELVRYAMAAGLMGRTDT